MTASTTRPGDRPDRPRASGRAALGPALALALLVPACGGNGGDGASEAPSRSELLPGVAARLDSGNAAYRARDFDEARRHYRRATELDPDLASAWYGVYMAETALGNGAAADSALERAGATGEAAGAHHPAPGGEAVPRSHPPIPPPDGADARGG